MSRISKVAKLMAYITQGSIGLLVIAFMYVWSDKSIRTEVLSKYLIGIDQSNISIQSLFGGFLLSAMLFSMLIYGLYQCLQFFKLYRNNDIFPEKSGVYLSNFGLALCLLSPTTILIRSISSVMFSLQLPQGQRHLIVSIEGTDLLIIIVGGLIFMIGHILNIARSVAEENKQII